MKTYVCRECGLKEAIVIVCIQILFWRRRRWLCMTCFQIQQLVSTIVWYKPIEEKNNESDLQITQSK